VNYVISHEQRRVLSTICAYEGGVMRPLPLWGREKFETANELVEIGLVEKRGDTYIARVEYGDVFECPPSGDDPAKVWQYVGVGFLNVTPRRETHSKEARLALLPKNLEEYHGAVQALVKKIAAEHVESGSSFPAGVWRIIQSYGGNMKWQSHQDLWKEILKDCGPPFDIEFVAWVLESELDVGPDLRSAIPPDLMDRLGKQSERVAKIVAGREARLEERRLAQEEAVAKYEAARAAGMAQFREFLENQLADSSKDALEKP
jgi:hypothetical protein